MANRFREKLAGKRSKKGYEKIAYNVPSKNNQIKQLLYS